MSSFHRRTFLRFRTLAFNAPRRPRHPLLRVAVGLLGIALLLALVVVGVFVGAANGMRAKEVPPKNVLRATSTQPGCG